MNSNSLLANYSIFISIISIHQLRNTYFILLFYNILNPYINMTQVNPGGIFATTPILIPVSLKNKPKFAPVFNQQPYPKYIPRNIQMPGTPRTDFMPMMKKNPNINNNMSVINQQGKKQNYRGFNVGNK